MATKTSGRVPPSSAVGYVTSPVICVVVGSGDDSAKQFVHQGLIRPRSAFFDKALKEPWKQAEERKVTLAEEEPAIFALYLELLYTGKLPVKHIDDEENDTNEYTILSKLYVLAEMLIDNTTKDIVLEAMAAKSDERDSKGQGWPPAYEPIRIIYNGTTRSSPARQLLIRFYTESHFKIKDVMSDDIPKDFLFDLAVSLLADRPLRAVHEECMSQLAAKSKEVIEKEASLTEKTEQLETKSTTIVTLESEKKTLEKDNSSLRLKVSAQESTERSLEMEVEALQDDLRHERAVSRQLLAKARS